MIYITGDCHGIHDIAKLSPYNFDDSDMTKDDYLIICGDMGLIWSSEVWADEEDDYRERVLMNFYNSKKCRVLFLDGNHENHARLNNYPVQEWYGGKIHVISDNIYHLMRGQVFDIDGKKIFIMGGAASTDKKRRIEDVSWWKEEIPNNSEREEAMNNLRNNNFKVDYILTHTGPTSTLKTINADYRIDEYTDWLEEINKTVDFKHWYFGHFHTDKRIDNKHSVVFNEVSILL